MTRLIPLLLSFLIISIETLAQQEDTTRIYELDQVVITGTRIKKEKAKIPNSVTIVGEQEIEASGDMNVLPLLSSKVPGLFLNERGIVGFGVGPRSGGGISMRGLGSSGDPANTRVLVLVDGQPQFMGVFGHPIHDSYFSTNVERVEVIRGPASILYGSNAMGGAINLITKKQKKQGYHVGVEVGYGSFNTRQYSAQGGLKNGKFDASFAANYVYTDGHREDANNEFSTIGAYGSVGYMVNDHFKLRLDGNVSDSYFYDPGTIADPVQENNKYDFLRGRVAFSVDNVHDKLEGSLRFFYNFGDHEFADGFNSNDINQGFTFYQNFKPFAGNVFTFGVDHKRFGGEATNPVFTVDESIDETDFYLLIQQSIDKLNLNAGVRMVNNSMFGSEWIPQVGASYNATTATTFKVSASKGFRSPALANLYFFPWSNPDLGPERMWNYEVSYLQSLQDGKASLEITGFIARGDNLIQVGRIMLPTINSGEFNHKGIEFAGAYRLSKGLNLTANYSYLDMTRILPYAPGHQLNVQLDYHNEKWRMQAGVRIVDDLLVGAVMEPVDREAPLENYTLLNFRASYALINDLSIFAEANNLLDQEYQIDRGYPLPGANLMAGVKYRLRDFQ